MTNTAAAEQLTTKTEVKTAGTRLLDLLAGWERFVSSDEEAGVQDVVLTTDELGALYQEAGRLIMALEDAEAEDEAVYEFVQERILPLLLRRQPIQETT